MRLIREGIAIIESDNYLSAEIFMEGRLDVESAHALLNRCRQHIPIGGVALDIGASLGDTAAVLWQMMGPAGLIYAFEPQKEVFECLVYNTRGMKNIVPIWMGLGDQVEVVNLVIDHNNIGASRLERGEPSDGVQRCHVRPLDSLSFDKLDFIKLDAEGWEPLILDGAVATIQQFRPTILMEINTWPLGKMGFTPQGIWDRLNALNYIYEKFDGPYGDVLCLPSEKVVHVR